jgi:hypothetical protein
MAAATAAAAGSVVGSEPMAAALAAADARPKGDSRSGGAADPAASADPAAAAALAPLPADAGGAATPADGSAAPGAGLASEGEGPTSTRPAPPPSQRHPPRRLPLGPAAGEGVSVTDPPPDSPPAAAAPPAEPPNPAAASTPRPSARVGSVCSGATGLRSSSMRPPLPPGSSEDWPPARHHRSQPPARWPLTPAPAPLHPLTLTPPLAVPAAADPASPARLWAPTSVLSAADASSDADVETASLPAASASRGAPPPRGKDAAGVGCCEGGRSAPEAKGDMAGEAGRGRHERDTPGEGAALLLKRVAAGSEAGSGLGGA